MAARRQAESRTNRKRAPRLAFVALGCPKALVDSERMLGDLGQAGYVLTDRADQADAIVVNTCGFLAAARDEALDHLRELAPLRRSGRCKRLVVTGCLVQRDGKQLLDVVPEIDALVGVHDRDKLIDALTADGPAVLISQAPAVIGPDSARLRLTPPHWAYLRISEGCSQRCAFCAIPAIRGPIRSKPPEMILAEARELIADGASELILIGQETTSYGRDIGNADGLAGLLRQLDAVDGVRWLRLMYAYPSTFTDATIDAIADCDRVAKYVDLPIQHISDPVLQSMRRRVTRAETEALLGKLRDRVPGVAIRTTILVGYPGETDAQFDELLRFVEDFQFDALGAFAYSPEEGTPSADLPDHVPEDVKDQRLDALMMTQQRIAFQAAAARQGDVLELVVDGPDEQGNLMTRHQGQAPDIDAVTLLQRGRFEPGSVVMARCTGSNNYDLLAEPADNNF